MHRLSERDINLQVLTRDGEGLTRLERRSDCEPVKEIPGPILHERGIDLVHGDRVFSLCDSCMRSLRRSSMPPLALANGRWIGQCPSELQGLSYVEQLLISIYRHNYCVAQVRQGQRFMVANAVVFQQPVSKVYRVLPPPR
ncbi:hypothetical protein LXA43DRAFT_877425, partial [Ganoderma leucocontextum]